MPGERSWQLALLYLPAPACALAGDAQRRGPLCRGLLGAPQPASSPWRGRCSETWPASAPGPLRAKHCFSVLQPGSSTSLPFHRSRLRPRAPTPRLFLLILLPASLRSPLTQTQSSALHGEPCLSVASHLTHSGKSAMELSHNVEIIQFLSDLPRA